jgi:hypothetical protein
MVAMKVKTDAFLTLVLDESRPHLHDTATLTLIMEAMIINRIMSYDDYHL